MKSWKEERIISVAMSSRQLKCVECRLELEMSQVHKKIKTAAFAHDCILESSGGLCMGVENHWAKKLMAARCR
jgi:hypothetical protein